MTNGRAETLTPRQARLVLLVVSISLMTVVSAVSGLNVALPSLARATGASQTELTWIVDAYTVIFAGVGAVLSLLAVGGIVFGIIEIPERGRDDPLALGVLAVGLAALVAFVLWEWRSPAPLLDPRLFRVRGFSMGSLSLSVQFFAAFGFFFAALQYLQFVAGLSPLWAAARLLPMPFILIPLARFSPRLAERFGYRRVAPVGLLLIAAAFVVFAQLEVELNYAVFGTGIVLFALGMALSGAPSTTAITQSLPASKQGVASAVNDTAREFGSALGIAVLGSILTATYKSGIQDAIAGLPPEIATAIESSIAFTQSPRVADFGAAATPIIAAAKESFLSGVTTALLTAACVLAVTALLTATFGPRRPSPDAPPPLPARVTPPPPTR